MRQGKQIDPCSSFQHNINLLVSFSGAFAYDKLHAAVEGATPSDVMVRP